MEYDTLDPHTPDEVVYLDGERRRVRLAYHNVEPELIRVINENEDIDVIVPLRDLMALWSKIFPGWLSPGCNHADEEGASS